MSVSPERKSGKIPPVEKRSWVRRFFRWTERLLACVGLCFVIYHLCFEFTVMTSDSMAPTLNGTSYENGDSIVLEKISGHLHAPRRWDIYFFYDSEGNPVAKRIVGLPGEKISIKTNQVYINGVLLEKPSNLKTNKYYAYGSLANGNAVDCGNGYFMMGDASEDSLDSRYTGIVTRDRFRGRPWCILSPWTHAGFVH
jgi:signal peptidase I